MGTCFGDSVLCPECGLALTRAEVSEGEGKVAKESGGVCEVGGVGKRIMLTFKKLVVAIEEPVDAEVNTAVVFLLSSGCFLAPCRRCCLFELLLCFGSL